MLSRSRLVAVTLLASSSACTSPGDPGGEGDEIETGTNDTSSEAGTGTDSSGTSSETETASETDGGEAPPMQPEWLVVYATGNPDDALIEPLGPGLLLMGGGVDVDAAFAWQSTLIAGGDVVVLRSSGADGYNDYLYTDIGGIDSVHTILADSPAAASDPWVAWTVAHAEAVFMAGGDQSTYLLAWKDTPVEDAIMTVWQRGGVIGGTSAGTAVLGELIYAAYNDSTIEDEALLDPFNKYMSFERDFLALPPLAGVITDTHFTARRRLCRLIAFVARMVEDGWGDPVVGIGVDEETALVVDPSGLGTVLGVGDVHVLHSAGAPLQCVAGKTLEYADLDWYVLGPGETVQLPGAVPMGAPMKLSASMGALDPAYDCSK